MGFFADQLARAAINKSVFIEAGLASFNPLCRMRTHATQQQIARMRC
jgi:hypothetical protein